MQKRWNILNPPPEKIESLQQSLKIHSALCKILVERGIDTFEEAKQFFRPTLASLHDPWLMKDMKKAVDRIHAAFDLKEKILVFGDYDVDGTTAVACMFQFLKSNYANVDFYIPHRYREGYGVSKAGIDFAFENQFSLVIALDCGIKSVDLINYAKELGIDFIVCDHHLPDEELPPAIAILNPKQEDCNYPYKELCGCGVGFKLITAMGQSMNLPEQEVLCYLDLVATAIAADIVPMTGENRILTFYGLKKANENPNFGIGALIKLSSITKELLINNLVFMIAPRINAAGRMDDARKAVQMFIAGNYEDAFHYAEMLHNDNTNRKETDFNITEEALELIQSDSKLIKRNSTVVYQSHWHKGVVGIVASRLIEHYYRPTIVLTKSGDYVAGSARSISGFNVYEAIHQCRDLLLGYGGHYYAAGMTMQPDMVDAFCQRFEEVVSSTILPESLIPEIVVDAEITFNDIRWPFYKILCQMEPFGPGNLRPVFLIRKVYNSGYSKIIREKDDLNKVPRKEHKEEHVRFVLRQDNITLTGIGFNMADKFSLLQMQKPVDIICKLDENDWNGNKSLQLRILDLRLNED